MPEVQNVGAADYAQYQQPQTQYEDYADYNTQPEIYDENYAQMQEASKARTGASLFVPIIIGGGIAVGTYFLGSHNGKKAGETAKKTAEAALEEIKNSEAVKNYDKLKEVTENAITGVETMAKKGAGKRFGAERCGNGFNEKLEEFFKPVKENIEKAKKDVKKAAEETKETVEKSVDEAKDTAKETAEKANNAE